MARVLRVRYVVGGTIWRSGSELRVNPYLTDAATGAALPVASFGTTTLDPSDARRGIVHNFARPVATALLDAEARRLDVVPVERLEAADLVLSVEAATRHVIGAGQNDHLIGLLERALKLDPSASGAMISLAHLLLRPWLQRDATDAPPLQRAKLLVETARRNAAGQTTLLMTQALLLRTNTGGAGP